MAKRKKAFILDKLKKKSPHKTAKRLAVKKVMLEGLAKKRKTQPKKNKNK